MHISSLNSSGASKKGGSVVSQLRRRRSHIFCNKSFAPIFPPSSPSPPKTLFPSASKQDCEVCSAQTEPIPISLLKFPLCKLSSNSFWLCFATTQFIPFFIFPFLLLLSQRSSLAKENSFCS